MRLLRIIGLMLTMLVLYVPSSLADPITFVYTGTASGSIGATPFTNAAFTITAFGDTANRQFPAACCISLIHDSASISIAQLGNFTFITLTRTVMANDFGSVALLSTTQQLLTSPPNFLPFDWGMDSSIGPVAGTWTAQNWILSPISTSGGLLVFNNGEAPGTFTATVGEVPEPASLTLLGLGLGVASFARLRRRK